METLTVGAPFDRQLKDTEQPYQRVMQIDKETKSIQGWIEECSCLHIQFNKPFLTTIPTKEEAEQQAQQLVVVSIGDSKWKLSPGESMRGCPVSLKDISVFCNNGVAQITVTIFPR
jgi:hypothetical protein